MLELYWNYTGTILVRSWYWYSTITKLVLDWYSAALRWYWHYTSTIIVRYWYVTGHLLVLYWYYTGAVLVLYWYYTGALLILSWYSLVPYWYHTGTPLALHWHCTSTTPVLCLVLYLRFTGTQQNRHGASQYNSGVLRAPSLPHRCLSRLHTAVGWCKPRGSRAACGADRLPLEPRSCAPTSSAVVTRQ